MNWRRTKATVLIEAVKQGHPVEVLTFGDGGGWYDPPRRVASIGPRPLFDVAVKLDGGGFFGDDVDVTWRFADV